MPKAYYYNPLWFQLAVFLSLSCYVLLLCIKRAALVFEVIQ